VGAGDRQLVLVALELRGLDRTRLQPDLDLGDALGNLHPQVDQVDLAVAADGVDVAARMRHARDVHRVAGLEDVDDLLAVAVDQGDLARVAQGDREDVVEVVVVHLPGRTLVLGDEHRPAVAHLLQAPLRRIGGGVLEEARHQVDLGGGELAAGAEVGHAAGRTEVDQRLEVFGAARLGEVGRERLAGGALAQHAVAAGAALEEDLAGLGELDLAHVRGAGGADLRDVGATDGGRRAFVRCLRLTGAGVHFALGRVGGDLQAGALRLDLGLGDAAAWVAPLVQDIGGDGGDVGVADVA